MWIAQNRYKENRNSVFKFQNCYFYRNFTYIYEVPDYGDNFIVKKWKYKKILNCTDNSEKLFG